MVYLLIPAVFIVGAWVWGAAHTSKDNKGIPQEDEVKK